MRVLCLVILCPWMSSCLGPSGSPPTSPSEPAAEPAGELRKEFYANGAVKSEGRWLETNGTWVKHGMHAVYRENGEKEGEYGFRRGLKHGRTVRWHAPGVKAFDCVFVDDAPQSQQCAAYGADGRAFNLGAIDEKSR